MNRLLSSTFLSSDLVIQLLWISSAAFTVTGLCLLFFVLASRKRKTFLAWQQEELYKKCQPVVTELAFEEKLSTASLLAEKELMATSIGRNALLAELIKFRKYFQGETVGLIENYYIDKKLYKLSFKKLHSRSKHLRISALNELVEMDYQPAVRTISRYLKHEKDPELIENAVVALARLDYRLCVKEILSRNLYLTDWLQIQLIQVFDEVKATDLPPLRNWMQQAPNFTYLIFGCRLVAFSKSQKQVEPMKELLWHPEERVRLESIRTFGILHYLDISPTLITIFDLETRRNQCEIIKTLTQFNLLENLPFLISCTQSRMDEIKRIAKDGIHNLSKAGELPGLHTPIIAFMKPAQEYLLHAV